ncbi:hypothetical protein PABG_05024 [Paracoccidioides brasiliensis Pb03]|nr:hypothetical protein PABG_05024 [Paracoccidioides brasiliensis Pb03]
MSGLEGEESTRALAEAENGRKGGGLTSENINDISKTSFLGTGSMKKLYYKIKIFKFINFKYLLM